MRSSIVILINVCLSFFNVYAQNIGERTFDYTHGNIEQVTMLDCATYAHLVQEAIVCCIDVFLVDHEAKNYFIVLRTSQPAQGVWWLIGGRIFKGESYFDAARRKCKGEAGFEIEPLQVINTYRTIFPQSAWNSQTDTINTVVLARLTTAHQQTRLDEHHGNHAWIPLNQAPSDPYVKQVYIDALKILAPRGPECSVTSSFYKNSQPTQALKDIFVHIGHPINSLEEANDFAQKNLLRSGERWDAQSDNDLRKRIQKNREILLQDLRRLGMIDQIMPCQKHYSYALVMGSLRDRAEKRLDSLIRLMEMGYTFDTIVLLGGQRTLRDDERINLPASIHTEADMMRHVASVREKLKKSTILLVDAPMIKKADGILMRPTTEHTLEHFVKITDKGGSCLVISDNPYATRQILVARRILDQSLFPVSGYGEKIYEEERSDIIMLMDEFARTLYEEFKSAKKESHGCKV